MDSLLPPDHAGPATPIHAVAPDGIHALGPMLETRAADWVAVTGFKAAAGAVLLIPGESGVDSVFFGLGAAGADESSPLLAGKLPTALPPGVYKLAEGFADPALAAFAWAAGAYRFGRYREAPEAGAQLVVPSAAGFDALSRIVEGVTLARDLVNTPSNDMGPAELAEAARSLAAKHGASFAVTVGDDLLAAGFPLIHAVGAAALPSRAPRLIDIGWGDPAAPKVTLVGKGVCFDTGGLDIKTSSGMLLMKKDMGGAANVLGLAHMIMSAGLPVRLRVLIPAVENAIAGAAFRPGDVFKSRKGVTVEIGNTDAEGRLVLADALALASEETPALIVDMATLTGAARVALGPEVVPFYTRHDPLAADVAKAAAAVADPVWRMPLWSPYMTYLDSRVAEINNAGSSPHAGSITAALFLSRFVPRDIPWLHFDIFAWNPATKPARPEGGEAQAIRALFTMLRDVYGRA